MTVGESPIYSLGPGLAAAGQAAMEGRLKCDISSDKREGGRGSWTGPATSQIAAKVGDLVTKSKRGELRFPGLFGVLSTSLPLRTAAQSYSEGGGLARWLINSRLSAGPGPGPGPSPACSGCSPCWLLLCTAAPCAAPAPLPASHTPLPARRQKMERSSFPFTYKGSIAGAITEAQTKKRLFVVYISGGDDASTSLKQSTWMDQRVVKAISDRCIFLHLLEGSVDALQFSAIYPQNSVPNISVVGFNGVMIWQHGGFISAENLVENVEKAWATLQLQETAAVLLTATLASKKSESSTSSIIASHEEGSSSSTNELTSINNYQNSDVTPLTNFAERENEVDERISGKDKKSDGKNLSSRVVHASSCTISADTNSRGCDAEHKYENSRVTSEEEENTVSENIKRATNCSTAWESRPKSDQDDPVHDCDSESQGNPEMIAKEVEGTQEEKAEVPARSLNATRPTDVLLNIRLPSGTCLQMRFSLTDTLRSVKNYVDENTVSKIGAYDLAIPYPRKIFMDQDMSKTISELGFASREALIVVPHQHVAFARQVQSLNEADASNNDSGYFAFFKRILSYVNPLAYLSGNTHSSSPGPVPNSLPQQGPTPWSNPSAVEGSYYRHASGERDPQPGNNPNTATRRTPSRFGGNIHTLRDVERDDRSGDRNIYWNGNSTQFGGDDGK